MKQAISVVHPELIVITRAQGDLVIIGGSASVRFDASKIGKRLSWKYFGTRGL
jgi:hypothetical protein